MTTLHLGDCQNGCATCADRYHEGQNTCDTCGKDIKTEWIRERTREWAIAHRLGAME